MVARYDLTPMELGRVKMSDVRWCPVVKWQIEHLVEVAIVEGPVPSDREGVAAHDTGRSCGIKGVDQPLHVALVIAALDEKFEEPADRHVGDRIETVELDAMADS